MKQVSKRVRFGCIGIAAVLLISAGVGAIVHYAAAGTTVYFSTLPPGAKLPSGAQCAREVLASPSPENRPGNARFNAAAGYQVGAGIFPSGDSPQAAPLASRIDGDFTGSTEDILRWVACKWGIDQDIVFAEAATESWWNQTQLGDWQANAANCPPGHGLGADGRSGQCPESYGILQDKYIYLKAGWPGLSASTAMNADIMYGIWRSCYDGDEVWLNDQPRGKQYQAGDVWGCIGRWFAGSWYTSAADGYIAQVKQYMSEQVWEQPSFAETQAPAVHG